MEKSEYLTYDFAFIGLGASNSLILLSLIQKGLLLNKRVVVFETESKTINDKTYCFWSDPNEQIVSDLHSIISHRFNRIQVSHLDIQRIDEQQYFHIRSIDLYNHTLQVINETDIRIFRLGITNITQINELYSIHSSNDRFNAQFIFDSRPPNFLNKKQIYLNQSFYGLHIKCENNAFEKNVFEMMNFNIDQHDFTQFIYVIPFSSNEALIELTRFGEKKINVTYAKDVLSSYIIGKYGDFDVLADELGCIPMTTSINPPSSFKGVLHTGASANLIKPSTGYAFKRMHEFAQVVSKKIELNELDKFNEIQLSFKNRFKFYDKLLLIILLYWPSKGKLIFTRLFERQSVLRVFSFLDEKTSIFQELKIFIRLPIIIFLKALFLHFKAENLLRYSVVLLSVIIYYLLNAGDQEFAQFFSYTILIIGLLTIGIPHGALDHLLSKNKNGSLLVFILKYLSFAILYYIFWQMFPLVSLLIFICYSAFHFGESEIIEAGEKTESSKANFKAFILGLNILIFIIFSHSEESLRIVGAIVSDSKSIFNDINFSIISSFLVPFSFVSLIIQSLVSKKSSYIGLLFFLIIGVTMPLFFAFGIYFIFQHSSNAWQHLKSGLKMNSVQMFKKSFFYTLAAFLIFILILLNSNHILNMKGLVSNFFIFIACISLPHFFLMHSFYKRS